MDVFIEVCRFSSIDICSILILSGTLFEKELYSFSKRNIYIIWYLYTEYENENKYRMKMNINVKMNTKIFYTKFHFLLCRYFWLERRQLHCPAVRWWWCWSPAPASWCPAPVPLQPSSARCPALRYSSKGRPQRPTAHNSWCWCRRGSR